MWPHTFVSPSADSRGAVVSYWRKYVHEVLVNRLGGLSLPRKSVVRLTLTDRPDMTLDVYLGRKTTTQQQHELMSSICFSAFRFTEDHFFSIFRFTQCSFTAFSDYELQVITRKQAHIDEMGNKIHTCADTHKSASRRENRLFRKNVIWSPPNTTGGTLVKVRLIITIKP